MRDTLHHHSVSPRGRVFQQKADPTIPVPSASIGTVSINDRTNECLDFPTILGTLRNMTITQYGQELSSQRFYTTPIQISAQYEKVEELLPHIAMLPIRNYMNIWPLLSSIEFNTVQPTQEDLVYFTRSIEDVIELRTFILQNNATMQLYSEYVSDMSLPQDLADTFLNAFDDDDNLNSEKYPILGQYRKEILTIKSTIIQTLNNLLRSPLMKDKLADQGYVEFEGRFCLMLKNTYKKGFGIVHSSSNTGRTLYIEPMEVVDMTNEMKAVGMQLKQEENRIFFEMCKVIYKFREEISAAVHAVGEVDVLRAKCMLGRALQGVVPTVADEGVIRCANARHPVLLLRGSNPRGNDIELDAEETSLVISGPNAGGKTIVLKTAGLFGLMVRHSIPLPTDRGARFDVMNVMADIGDMQSVSGDLSTFSGHLLVCREMLRSTKEYDGTSLVLLDEIGTGTDPAQGAALAQAVLEELVELGSRVIVTTHYQRVKELAAGNPKFKVAAMEFVDNRPTYRLRMGSIGESYALETARRLMLPETVLHRANLLLDDETKRLLSLQQRLEVEIEKARSKQIELDMEVKGLEAREEEIEREKLSLQVEIAKLREGKTDEFLVELRTKERELDAMMRKVHEIMNASQNTTRQERERVIDDVKSEVKNVRMEVEKEVVEQVAEDLATPLVPGEPIDEGQVLMVLEKGSLFGSRGVVTQRNKGRGRVVLRIAGVEVKMERHLLGVPHRSGQLGFLRNMSDSTVLSAKDQRLMKMLKEDLVDPDKLTGSGKRGRKKEGKVSGTRSSANTVDVRGLGTADAQAATGAFIQSIVERSKSMDRFDVVFINHGNTKDSAEAKAKLRLWLKKFPLVTRMNPAELSDGGDAFTIAELDLVE